MKKIAVVRRNGLGDFISGAVPLCNYLMKKYNGEVEFYFFMNKRNFGLARYFFRNSKSILIPDGNKYYTHIATGLKNRDLAPDIGIIPVPDYPKLGAVFMKALGAKEIYGNVGNEIIPRLFINHPCTMNDNVPYEHVHVSLRSLNLFDTDLKETPREFYPRFLQSEISEFSINDTDKKLFVMVELSNNRKTSQLSIEKLAPILNRLSKDLCFTALITAMPKDQPKVSELGAILQCKYEYHATKSLDDFIAYVNKSDLVLAGDGGLSHIAGALGKKLVTLYAETPLERWGVLGEHVVHLFDADDVNNISDEKIYEAIKSLL